MRRDELDLLAKILRRNPAEPATRPTSMRTRIVERWAIADVIDLYAREAVVALQDLERTFPEGSQRRRQAAARFGRLYEQAGLDALDPAKTSSGPRRILAAVNALAKDTGSDATVDEAARRLEKRGLLNETPDAIRRSLSDRYGPDPQPAATPGDRLRQALVRLGNAQVIDDLSELATTTGVSLEVRRAVGRVVNTSERLDDSTRSRAAAVDKAQQTSDRYDGAVTLLRGGLLGGAVAIGQHLSGPTVACAAVLWLAQGGHVLVRRDHRDRAAEKVGEHDRDIAIRRTALDTTVDGAVGRLTRPSEGDRRRGGRSR